MLQQRKFINRWYRHAAPMRSSAIDAHSNLAQSKNGFTASISVSITSKQETKHAALEEQVNSPGPKTPLADRGARMTIGALQSLMQVQKLLVRPLGTLAAKGGSIVLLSVTQVIASFLRSGRHITRLTTRSTTSSCVITKKQETKHATLVVLPPSLGPQTRRAAQTNPTRHGAWRNP